MYTPDGTEVTLAKVSPAAGRMYLYYCRWRDHETGYSRKGFEHARADLKLTRATAYRAHRELLGGDFICETRDGVIGLRGGSFKPMDKTEAATKVWATSREILPEQGSLKIETEAPPSLKIETESLKIETNSLKNETGPYKDRARESSSTSSSSSPATHTPPTPSLSPEGAEAAEAGVCVDLKFEDYRDFARSTPGFTKPDAWAMKHYALRDADVLVREFLGQRELVRAGRAAQAEQPTPFHVAAQYVNSFRARPGADVAAYIAGLENVSDETRARLRSTFLPEQARAHAPP
jgi:hypothetical protein